MNMMAVPGFNADEGKAPADRIRTMTAAEIAEVELFPNRYWGKRYFCRFTDFYDGDTATIVFDDEGRMMASKFRFFGYDSPEIKVPRSVQGDERATRKAAGAGARDHLEQFLSNRSLIVEFSAKREKWGRLMGEVYYFDQDPDNLDVPLKNKVSEHMISEGYGYAYAGGKKKEWNL